MAYLIDTNVISEVVKPRPSVRVVAWFRSVPREDAYLSVLTFGELLFGIERLPDARRREALRQWLETDVKRAFAGRLLHINEAVADRWARLRVEVAQSTPAVDSLIAATALHHDLRLATRNERDFLRFPGLSVFNPWQDAT